MKVYVAYENSPCLTGDRILGVFTRFGDACYLIDQWLKDVELEGTWTDGSRHKEWFIKDSDESYAVDEMELKEEGRKI